MKFYVSRFCSLLFATLLLLLCGGVLVTRAQSGGSVGTLVNLPSGSAKRKPATPRPTPRPGRPKPVADNSEQVEAALELGDQERAANPPRNAEAEKAYLLAAKLGPRDARPHVGLGNIYYDQKKYTEAEAEYRRGALLNPADGTAYARLAFMYSARYQNEKAPTLLDQAIGFARRSTAAQPSNYYCFVALGWTTYLKEDYPSAEAAYRRSIELSPSYAALYVELARVLTSERRYRDAMVPLTKAIELDPKNYTAHFLAGVMQQKLGLLDKSAEQYTVAIQLNPKASEARSNVGLIYYMLSQWTKAREQWNAAISLGSTYAPDRIGLLILDGNLTDARTQLQEYTKNSADDEDGWLMLGDVLRALGDEQGARAADTHAAQIAPDYVGLRRPTLPRGRTASRDSSTPSSSDNVDVRSRNEKGATPLMVAAENGQADRIPALLAKGADINAKDSDGWTALMYAMAPESSAAAETLLSRGAAVDAQENQGRTALMIAAFQGRLAVVRMLIKKGANVNARDKKDNTPLKYATLKNQTEVIKLLKSIGATQ
jgi:tetratricopeptide (TPR) repeat protein